MSAFLIISAIFYAVSFPFLIWGSGPLATLLHEFGHAIAARLMSRRRSDIFLGEGPFVARTRLCGIGIFYSHNGPEKGFCRYEKILLSTHRKLLIVAAGPAFSALGCCASILLFLNQCPATPLFAKLVVLAFALANIRVLFDSLIPRFQQKGGSIWMSDGMDLLNLMRRIIHHTH